MKLTSTVFTFFVYIIGFDSRTSLILGNNILPDLYWNTTNPIFLISNTDHIIDVNQGTVGHQHDQINIVCPKYEEGTPKERMERHMIYNVNKEEYDSCMIHSKNPRIIAYCTKPLEASVFTIRFRSFSPMPNALEFHSGQSYYFISTSSPLNYTTRVGGYCRTNNMKVVFKVADRNSVAKKPSARLSDNVKDIEENVINTNAKAVKWNEDNKMMKKKYFYTGREERGETFPQVATNVIRDGQSLRDRKLVKDKMLSDEESKIYFYTTTKFMDQGVENTNQNFRTYSYRNEDQQEESILEKFSSSSSNLGTLSVSYLLLVCGSALL